MYFSTLILSGLINFAGLAFAAPGGHEQDAKTRCFTTMTYKPAPYKTYWHTTAYPCTNTKTKTKTVRTTLPPSTITDTTTSTVTATTSTLTETDTETVTTTVTETESTSTTTTVPTPFIPVQTSLPGSSYSGSSGPVKKRDGLTLPLVDAPKSPKLYPKQVDCYHYKGGHCHPVVTTITTTKTIPGGKTTTTTTELSTTYPSATTTVTTTSTATDTTTTTETSTATVTSGVAAATCNPDNFADTYTGLSITGLNFASVGIIVTTGANSAGECCQIGASGSATVGGTSVFAYAGNSCSFQFQDSCPAQGANEYSVNVAAGGSQVTVGNLMCGVIDTVVI